MTHHPEDRNLPLFPRPFSNGALRNRTAYMQCLKNHAAASGGHALDGCGEFMPSGESQPSDPCALKCAACGCHRNFHRRVLHPSAAASPPRKRARTKFSDEQKLKMKELSEKIGWRMQKGDGAMVESVCREIGVDHGVFKVWMHNNKHIFVGGSSSRSRGGAAVASSGDEGGAAVASSGDEGGSAAAK